MKIRVFFMNKLLILQDYYKNIKNFLKKFDFLKRIVYNNFVTF